MKVIETKLPGVLLIEPKVIGDSRGFLAETWVRKRYEAAGVPGTFVQDNVSFSRRGVLRGLHYQHPQPQGKLVQVLQGEVFDVALDIRVGSPTFGQWVAATLSGENHQQIYIPEGFAHGFCVTSETALFAYKCTDYYNPATEAGVQWDDPDLAIPWPVEGPAISEKDRAHPPLREVPEHRLPVYQGGHLQPGTALKALAVSS